MLTVPAPSAEQVRRERDQKVRNFLAKLRADLVWLGADRYLVMRMSPMELLENRSRRIKALQSEAPVGARFDL